MKVSDRVAFISEENLWDLLKLYGELGVDRLSEIVNNHVRVAIDEIKEDIHMANRVPHCSDCDSLQCIDYAYKNYYCDHEDRVNDVGYVGVDNPPKTSPEWCPKRKVVE